MNAIRNLQPISAMRGLGFDDYLPAVERLLTLSGDALVARLPAEVAGAESACLAVAPALLGQVDDVRQKLFKEVGDKRDARDQIMQRVRQHAAGESAAHLGESTELLCRKLRQNGMAPRVLCELVEVADPEWTAAAEALLGRDREAVFVDRADIVAATAIFKEGRREFRGASLVKLEQARAIPDAAAGGDLSSVFHSEDPDALAFIMRRYGNVRLANALSEFNAPGRAIMKDGLYDDGLVRTHRVMEPRNYKIGKSAQARLLTQLAEEAEELDELIVKGQAAAAAMDRAHHAISFLTEDAHGGLAALAASYAAAQAEKADAETRIAALDGAGDGGLRDRHKAQVGLKAARTTERKTQQHNFSRHDKEAAVLERKLADGDNVPRSDLNLKGAWSAFKEQLPLYNCRRGRPAHRARLDAGGARPRPTATAPPRPRRSRTRRPRTSLARMPNSASRKHSRITSTRSG